MIVGVGASRVRDLFKQAREAAPSIIFIDELDAIGRTRGSGAQLGGHDEREQTLNQILTEMDGFDSREGVIVLAATNRADVLDQALLRPGRFDRRVVVQRPDRAGRAAILKVHTKNVPLAPDVSLERIAAETPGLVGAELRNLVNEAALLAARKDASCRPRRGFRRGAAEDHARTGAQHPAQPGGSGAHGLPRGGPRAARAADTRQRPGAPRLDRAARHGARRDVSTPGRRSHQLRRGLSAGADHLRTRRPRGREARLRRVTTGAENDLQQVTEIARHMVLRWGMSEKLGPISFVAPQDDGSAAGLPAPALQRGDLRADRRRSPAHRRGEPPRSRPAAGRAPRQARGSRPGPAESRIARRRGRSGRLPAWPSRPIRRRARSCASRPARDSRHAKYASRSDAAAGVRIGPPLSVCSTRGRRWPATTSPA